MNTILLVENDHAPRMVFGQYLGNQGFTVLEAADVAEALVRATHTQGRSIS